MRQMSPLFLWIALLFLVPGCHRSGTSEIRIDRLIETFGEKKYKTIALCVSI